MASRTASACGSGTVTTILTLLVILIYLLYIYALLRNREEILPNSAIINTPPCRMLGLFMSWIKESTKGKEAILVDGSLFLEICPRGVDSPDYLI
jgi:hypothetical protein